MGSEEKSSLEQWVERGWREPEAGEHALHVVGGREVDGVTTRVLIGPKNRFGAVYFQVYLVDERGAVSDRPAVLGLHNAGPYPSQNWVETMSVAEQVSFGAGDSGRTLQVGGTDLERALLKLLADVIPPGGHMMVEYDSAGRRETARGLHLGIPAAATPLGYLLYSVGCGTSFRDWYFAEGGVEGPRKLQGYKALNEEHARERGRELARELLSFVQSVRRPEHGDIEGPARTRALEILRRLDVDDAGLKTEIERLIASG
ncbi:MAG: DUF1122 family protein [Chloroflexota bacterium]|nr:DUF1122 family protein [Chloroflexota bacterium]